MLRQQATVIAVSEAYANSETLEAVAEPDQIVSANSNDRVDRVTNVLCSACK